MKIYIVIACSKDNTMIDKVFSDKQTAINYAISMNEAAERVQLDIEHRIVEKDLYQGLVVGFRW